jgi:hypothetical protein
MIRQLPQLDFDAAKLEELCQRWSILELWVFGSAARNEMRPDSDVDLMATFAPETKYSLWTLVDLQDELQEIFGREVDIMRKGPIRNPYRRASIEKDLTLLYAA